MQNIQLPPHLQGELWSRLPKPGRPGQPGGRLEGLSRTTLLELSNAGLIRTVAIRKPGAVKGIRLVYMPSLYSYLENLTKSEASV
jgi:hypothetical protein